MSSFYDLASLVMIPSGKKAGKVYSQKPLSTDGQLDFTRASTATRIGSNGLIEKTRTNLLTYSNDFSNAAWIKGGSSVVSGFSSPNGTNNAYKLVEDSANSVHRIFGTSTVTASGYASISVYVKYNGRRYVLIRFADETVGRWYDLINGTLGGTYLGTPENSTIESVGNDWYRITLSNPCSSQARLELWVSDTESVSAYQGDGSSGAFIYGAQLEVGLVATNYIDTTSAAVSVGSVNNMPRLNYTEGSATSCPSLLLEPQRTNLETKSEYFEGWSVASNVTRTTNYTISPDGFQTASRLQFTANGFCANTPQSLATYTISCYAKRNNTGTQNVGFFTNGSGVVNSAWAVTSEWKRFSYTFPALNGSFMGIAGVSGADISVYGFQIEGLGTYATSYIPTFGATVTRTQDICNKASISGLIGQTAGTVFLDWVMNHESISTSEDFYSLALSDGTANKMILINNYNNALGVLIKEVSTQFYNNSFSGSDGLNIKLALAYANNDIALYINGNLIATDTSASIPTLNQINLNTYYNNVYADSSSVNNLMLFKSRLSNTQLAELTSLDS